jgi:hypothetical protein
VNPIENAIQQSVGRERRLRSSHVLLLIQRCRPARRRVNSFVIRLPEMIRDVLIIELRAEFPNRGLRIGESPEAIAVFPAAHPEVGDVSIYDDGNEAMVSVGQITHGHFGWEDPNRPEADIATSVTVEVVRFLTDLFANRVLLWRSSGGAGGWQTLGQNSSLSIMDGDASTYLWSGPVSNPMRENAG